MKAGAAPTRYRDPPRRRPPGDTRADTAIWPPSEKGILKIGIFWLFRSSEVVFPHFFQRSDGTTDGIVFLASDCSVKILPSGEVCQLMVLFEN